MISRWTTFSLIFRQNIAYFLQDKEKLLSPIAVSLLIFITLAVIFSVFSNPVPSQAFLAKLIPTVVFGMEIILSRIFEAEQEDRVFVSMKSIFIWRKSWFLAKFAAIFLASLVLVVPVVVISSLLDNLNPLLILGSPIFLFLLLAVLGQVALGISLCVITMSTTNRKVLFALLYFPLIFPLVIGCVFGSLDYFNFPNWSSFLGGWGIILIVMDILYFIIGFLLFEKLVDVS